MPKNKFENRRNQLSNASRGTAPTPQQARSLERLKSTCTVLGITAGCLVGLDAGASHAEIAALIRPATPQESLLQGAIHGSRIPNVGSLRIDCEPDNSMPEGTYTRVYGYARKELFTQMVMPVAHIRQSLCDSASAYADNPDKSNPSEATVLALDVITHEAWHYAADDGNEARTECRSVQRVANFAVALGANLRESNQVRSMDISVYFNDYVDGYQTDQCYDGGPLDLDPGQPGLFPYRLVK